MQQVSSRQPTRCLLSRSRKILCVSQVLDDDVVVVVVVVVVVAIVGGVGATPRLDAAKPAKASDSPTIVLVLAKKLPP